MLFRSEALLAESLDRCGGSLPDLPLASFDLVVERLQRDSEELRTFVSILRQNLELGASEMWTACPLVELVLERADFTGLASQDQAERRALAELLLGIAGQSLAAAACGRLSLEESRERLRMKIALIRRGLNMSEPSR